MALNATQLKNIIMGVFERHSRDNFSSVPIIKIMHKDLCNQIARYIKNNLIVTVNYSGVYIPPLVGNFPLNEIQIPLKTISIELEFPPSTPSPPYNVNMWFMEMMLEINTKTVIDSKSTGAESLAPLNFSLTPVPLFVLVPNVLQISKTITNSSQIWGIISNAIVNNIKNAELTPATVGLTALPQTTGTVTIKSVK